MRRLQAHPLLPGGGGDSLSEPSIAERLAGIRARIDEACQRAGRPASGVTLLGASKTQPAAAI
ncbi:MAG TPA: hypothetical protein VHU81_09745, partial [Thermoanaerobaculia bacterium]|nr:hypothetical protein [Thermoanaerobaculia bacterium]